MTPETFEVDYDFLADEVSYDPLAETEDEDIDEFPARNPELGSTPEPEPESESETVAVMAPAGTIKPRKKVDTRPAKERIESLFKEMSQRRRILLGLLDFVRIQRSAESLSDEVERLQRYDGSVYNSANYAGMLEAAGAIKKLNDDGTDFDVNVEQEPDIVVIDGIEYLKPTDGKRVCWIITPEGLDFLNSDRPIDRLNALLDREEHYAPIYKRVLAMCADENGCTIAEIGARVDKDPMVQDPRYYGSNFINKLEKCDAVIWENAWKTTSVGREGLARLANVADPYGEQFTAKKDGE